MPINRRELKGGCTLAFGERDATTTLVDNIIIELQHRNLRLGQVYWVGRAGKGSHACLALHAKVQRGEHLDKRMLHFSRTAEVVLDRTQALKNELAFGQNFDAPKDFNAARRQMGDFS